MIQYSFSFAFATNALFSPTSFSPYSTCTADKAIVSLSRNSSVTQQRTRPRSDSKSSLQPHLTVQITHRHGLGFNDPDLSCPQSLLTAHSCALSFLTDPSASQVHHHWHTKPSCADDQCRTLLQRALPCAYPQSCRNRMSLQSVVVQPVVLSSGTRS